MSSTSEVRQKHISDYFDARKSLNVIKCLSFLADDAWINSNSGQTYKGKDEIKTFFMHHGFPQDCFLTGITQNTGDGSYLATLQIGKQVCTWQIDYNEQSNLISCITVKCEVAPMIPSIRSFLYKMMCIT